MGKLVDYSAQDSIAVLQLDAPPANTCSYDLLRDLDDAILQARLDEKVHCIILRGKGDKFFCGGADIQMLKEKSSEFLYYFCLLLQETIRRLEVTPKIVIAALNGHALGGGLEMALGCDFRLAKRGASKIGLPEVNLGQGPGGGGTQRLPRILGYARAVELLTTGRLLSVEEALAIGLVHHVYDAETYWDDVMDFARQFCPPNKPPRAIGKVKLAARASLETGIAEGVLIEHEILQPLYDSEDLKEGIDAFLNHRKAIYRGR